VQNAQIDETANRIIFDVVAKKQQVSFGNMEEQREKCPWVNSAL